METILILASLASFSLSIVGLASPSTISKWCRRPMSRAKSFILFSFLGMIFMIMAGVYGREDASKIKTVGNTGAVVSTTLPKAQEQQVDSKANEVPKQTTKTSQTAPKTSNNKPPVQPATTQPEPPTQSDVYGDIRKRAQEKWPTDKSMENYEYNQQVTAYKQIQAVTKYPEILQRAKEKWSVDYTMQIYEYNQQKNAYEQMLEITKYPEIKERAQQKWPVDFTMQVYEYNQQKSSYEQMLDIPDSPEKRTAQTKWPNDYTMQVYEYNNQ